MKNLIRLTGSRLKGQRGATAVIVAIVFVLFLGFAALAIDVGYLFATRNELQNVADAAALAATRKLGTIYQALSYQEQSTYVCNPSTIIATAKAVASKNWAGGTENVTINDADVIIGCWDGNSVTPTLSQPDAVRVIARKDGSANGPITTFFAGILGIDSVGLWMDATAALTGQSTTEPGELELPIGISSYFYLPGNFCNDFIKFSPTNDPDSCSGWSAYTENPNDATVRKILDGLITSPATQTWEPPTIFNFIGGELSSPTFETFLTLFQNKGCDVDASGNYILDGGGNPMVDATGTGLEVPLLDSEGNQLLYPDGTPRNKHVWETGVVVYEWTDCGNPNASIPIAGYSTVLITDVLGPPDKMVRGKILCDQFSEYDTRGGGGEFGTKGSIPGLVE